LRDVQVDEERTDFSLRKSTASSEAGRKHRLASCGSTNASGMQRTHPALHPGMQTAQM